MMTKKEFNMKISFITNPSKTEENHHITWEQSILGKQFFHKGQ